MHCVHISLTMLFPASTWAVNSHVKETRKAAHRTLYHVVIHILCPYKIMSFKDVLTKIDFHVRNLCYCTQIK